MTTNEYNTFEKLADEIYKRGFRDAEEKYRKEILKERQESYENGLDAAWECARKISSEKFDDFSNLNYILKHYSAQEAISEIGKCEGKKYDCTKCDNEKNGTCEFSPVCVSGSCFVPRKEFNVGDEVDFGSGCSAVITKVNDDTHKCWLMFCDGSFGTDTFDKLRTLLTGRNFFQTMDIIKGMKYAE